MPRHIKEKAKTGAKAVIKRPKGDGWFKVKRVPVETAELIELGPDHSVWEVEDFEGMCKGAIVKLVPPPGTPESLVLHLERSMYTSGAVSVKVMPVQEEVVVTVEGVEFDLSGPDDDRSLRQVVMDRVERATNSQDVDALRALCTEAMDYAESQ